MGQTGIFLHWTFLLMLAGLFAFFLFQSASVTAALFVVGLVCSVFGCVLLHELGHAFMARRFNISTLDITLYPIGGVARLTSMPREPREEFWIAIAGPAVNLVIAAVLFVVNLAGGHPILPDMTITSVGEVLDWLMWINLSLVGFNMLPAFPMDGGRVLRAGLATRMNYKRATYIAGFVGQLMSFLLALYAIFSFNPILLFVSVFVFIAARQEVQQVMQQD
jgi:Zn-dependent protease